MASPDNTRRFLLKAADIEAMAGREITHFLNANAVRNNKSLGDAVGMSQMGVHLIAVEPGKDSTEFHKHLYEEEAIYILSGSGRLMLDDNRYAVAAGDFIGLPANQAAHALFNDGEEILTCLVMGQRLRFDVADYPNQSKRIYRHNGEADVARMEDITHPKIHTRYKKE